MSASSKPVLQESNLLNVNEDIFRLLELKDYAIAMIDVSGHIKSWNFGGEHIYGFSAKEVIGKHISTFYTEDAIRNGQPWINLKSAEETGRNEDEGWKYKKDRTTFYANTIITVLHNKNGSLEGFAKVTRDITRQKKLEDENKLLTSQLEEKVDQRTNELAIAVKELEAFSYSVSHDLRAPLRAISGYSIILKEDYQPKLDAEGNRIIDVIIDNTKMMSELIDDLLTFSKMARLEVVRDSISMKRLAEKCIADLLQAEKRTAYSINVLDLPGCKGDENMLKQVWFNLIGNAIKYSSKKLTPQIEVGAIDDPKTNIYYVRDNGAGFDMKYSNKLFGVFQRLHRNDEFEGTGVGLALAKRIVSKHGGEIWAEASVDQGACFYFSIPK